VRRVVRPDVGLGGREVARRLRARVGRRRLEAHPGEFDSGGPGDRRGADSQAAQAVLGIGLAGRVAVRLGRLLLHGQADLASGAGHRHDRVRTAAPAEPAGRRLRVLP